jgi:xylulokinase
MTGDFASDMSDAAGTMWLDVAKRDWSEAMLDACHLTRDHMPALFEGSEITGTLLPAVAKRWNMSAVPVVAGGDNAAGAVGVGMVDAGRRCSRWERPASILRSAMVIAATRKRGAQFLPCPAGKWHLMSVMSAASCLDWAKLTGMADVPALIAAAQQADENAGTVWFLPYLSGERTPHNNPEAKGVFLA